MIEIKLNKFKPRDYQLPICLALEEHKYRKLFLVMPRRSGKDLVCINLMIRQAVRRVGVYFYMLPTQSHARKVIWDSITNDGQRFLDFIPKEIIRSMNSQELKITLINGSILQFLGSDNFDSIVGTNPRMIVLSEYSLCDPRALQFFRPILNANGCTLIVNGTPRGRNHFYDLYIIARDNPQEWYCKFLTLDETKHISTEEIQREIDSGEVSLDLSNQEYYCSFEQGAQGAYYARYIDDLRLKGQIGIVGWESAHSVQTAWDLGMSDMTTIIFFQKIGQTIRIIDVYENNSQGLEHYAKVLSDRPYSYSYHWAPHDIAVRELGTGLSRLEKARQLGITFQSRESGTRSALPNVSIEDGIEAVRSSFSKMWIDEKNCRSLIKALENYRKEWDDKRKIYRDKPLHNDASHFADAFRYLVLSLSRRKDRETTEQDIDKMHNEARGLISSGMDESNGFFSRMYE